MPPYEPPRAPSSNRSMKYLYAALALLIIVGGVWAYVALQSPDWGDGRYLIQSSRDNRAYLFSQGEFAEEVPGPAPEARFSADGWPDVIVEQQDDGLYACTAEACDRIVELPEMQGMPAAFTIAGDTLYMLSPLSGELQAFTLIPGDPIRLAPRFSSRNTILPDATGMAFDPDTRSFLFVAFVPTAETARLEVCRAGLNPDTQVLKEGICTAYVLPDRAFVFPSIKPL